MIKKLVSVVIVSKDRKKDLIECIESYLTSSYKPLEIIVVDNASKQPLAIWLPKKYPRVSLITNNNNVGAAQGRNIGLSRAKGEYILFTDDDAHADKEMVEHLVSIFKKKPKAGIVQPLVYDKDRRDILQGAGHDINLITGRIWASGVKEKDVGQYDGLREVPMCGCVWMVKSKVFDTIGAYDSEYFIPYEDSDFSFRARKAGYKLYCYSQAKTWHLGKKTTFVNPLIEWLGITSSERAFRISRNKLIFISKHASLKNFLIFMMVFFPFYTILHSLIILITGRLDILNSYLKGVISGLKYSVSTKLGISK